MHPTLFNIGPFPVPTYGVALAVGFAFCVLVSARQGARMGLGMDRILDLASWILVGGLVGSRVIFVITTADLFAARCLHGAGPGPRSWPWVLYDCSRPLFFWEGGMVFYGAMLGSLGAMVLYSRRHGLGFMAVADAATPGGVLGHFFGRVGCYLAGCCYGKPASGAAPGVSFPPPSAAYIELLERGRIAPGAAATPPLHPTQLYEAGAELALFFALLWVSRRKRRHGDVLRCYLVVYAVVRFSLELVRGDFDRGFLVELQTPGLNSLLGLPLRMPALLSTSQTISLLVLAGALVWHLRLWALDRASPGPAPPARV